MPITSISTDPTNLTMTLVGEYPVPVERLWDAWIDPRQIERFWGPPTWPATFIRHDVFVGGRSDYVMTGPNGERSAGYWMVTDVDPGRRIDVVDGFSGDDGEPNDAMPSMTMRFTFESTENGSRFTTVTTFTSLESMEQLTEMGMVEGSTAALGQIDDVVADLASFAAGVGTDLQVLDPTRFRVSRVVRGSVDEVWRAHHEPSRVVRWMLGPDGWTMPVCHLASSVGESYRWEWEATDGSSRFGFEGELVASDPPHRWVLTERPVDTTDVGTVNETTLRAVGGGTLITTVITCPSEDVRDTILSSGMVSGLEASYARLQGDVLS